MHTAPGVIVEMAWQPQKADYRAAMRAALVTPARKVLWVVVVCLLGLCLCVMILLGLVTGRFDMPFGTLAMVVLGVGLPPVLPALFLEAAWRTNPTVRAPAHARIDPAAGISFTQGGSSVTHSWAAIGPIRETDEHFLIGLAAAKAIVIPLPKRSLTDPAQVQYLRYLFQNFLVRA
ncbi:YcxB family protein [Actinoplanes sp. NPDC051859]|uniref:YcxB family protein n=1 Tax=Actinoplanes sp. NPDC051859 TaxID=3363909 RepID=UPI00378CB96F